MKKIHNLEEKRYKLNKKIKADEEKKWQQKEVIWMIILGNKILALNTKLKKN